jgi:CRISPR-associated protein Csy1
MIDETIKNYIKGQKKLNTPELFIPDAAEKAKHITCATHPCQFSHPYANQDKNFKITPVVFYGAQSDDGYMRSGNVKSEQRIDMYGSAGFAAVMKFLALNMSNGKTVLENISDNTPEANELLSSSGRPAVELREQFLEVFKGDKQSENTQVTSSKIKQVFFPIGEEGQYHLLSLLTPSPLVYEMKKRLSGIMEDARNKKELIKKGELADSFQEIFNLTTLKYGGTQPQNISQLNTENGGITRLLPSMPPHIKDHRIRLPKRDFFAECLNKHDFKWEFDELFKLITLPQDTPITLEKQRKYRDRLFKEIVLTITEKLFAVREAFKEIPDTLKASQRVWLSKDETERLNANDWENDIVDDMSHWIIANLKNEHPVDLGDAELSAIKDTLTKLEDFWK